MLTCRGPHQAGGWASASSSHQQTCGCAPWCGVRARLWCCMVQAYNGWNLTALICFSSPKHIARTLSCKPRELRVFLCAQISRSCSLPWTKSPQILPRVTSHACRVVHWVQPLHVRQKALFICEYQRTISAIKNNVKAILLLAFSNVRTYRWYRISKIEIFSRRSSL